MSDSKRRIDESSINVLWLDDQIKSLTPWFAKSEQFGFSVRPCDKSDDFLDLIQQGGWDVILLDLRLGEENRSGIEILAEIRNRDKNTPIFVVSSFLDDETYVRNLDKYTLSGRIEKPLSIDSNSFSSVLASIEVACKKADLERLARKYSNINVEDIMSNESKDLTAFVIMPFSPPFDEVYEDITKPVLEKNGIRCLRIDDMDSPSVIMNDIEAAIKSADFLVAELTSKNANVFYELGMAHAFGKPVIMISQTLDDVPFDLRHRRVIIYTDSRRGGRDLKNKLANAVNSVAKAVPR